MSDRKIPIEFHDSMTADKRNTNFAYLRKNCLVPITSPGLYPSRDFYQEAPTSITGSVRNVLGTDVDGFDIKVIATDGSTTRFYNLGAEGESNTAITGSAYRASAFGVDGVYAATTDGKVYRAEHANGNTTEVGALGSSWAVELGGWDDVYYWWVSPGAGIYRQLPASNPVKIFDGAITGVRGMDFFESYMILFTQVARDIVVLWWDKADNSFFYRRVKVKNSIFLAGGVVDGRLMLVHFVGNSTNRKELSGEIVVSAWDGSNFTRLNSIRAGTPNLNVITGSTARQVTFSTGAEVLEFAVDGNVSSHNPDLYQNYIYRIRKDGRIEVRAKPETSGVSIDRASLVRVFHDFSLYAVNSPFQIYINRDTETGYDEYNTFRTTEYITNFIANPYNDHKMDGLSISFEKIFQVPAPPVDPIPGNSGNLSTANVGPDSLDVLWTKATSHYYPQSDLEYKVYMSTSNNITTIEDMIANGTMVQDWTTDISTVGVTGLASTTTYYFNIIVKDPDGNEVAYLPTSATTTTPVTAWASPTANSTCELMATPLDSWTNPTNAYAADGVFATAADVRYQLYWTFGLSIPGGATIVGIEVMAKGKVASAGPTFRAKLTKSGTTSPFDYGDLIGVARSSAALTTDNEERILGGPTDLWGSTWTPAELNANGFGLVVEGNTSPANYSLDWIAVRVYYTI